MKKLLTAFAFLVLLYTNTFSQNTKNKKVSIEFSLGGTFSGLYNAEAPHPIFINTTYPVTLFGSTVEESFHYHPYSLKPFHELLFNLSPQLSLIFHNDKRPDFFLNVAMRKRGIDFRQTSTWQKNNTVTTDTIERKIVNNYIDLAAGLRHSFKGRKIKPYIFGGLYAGVLIDEKASLFSGRSVYQDQFNFSRTHSEIPDQKQDSINGTQRIDYGIMIGGGAEYTLNEKWGIFFKTSIQIGLHKTDRHNNNEYEYYPAPVTTGTIEVYHSRNYYGFSSKSKYYTIEPAIGVRYILN
jgi:hypothetical protein